VAALCDDRVDSLDDHQDAMKDAKGAGLTALQLLGHTKIESTVRYLIEVDDALAIAEQVGL
jgi:hypothetical protein